MSKESTERSAMKLALEALESGKPMFDAYWGGNQHDKAITALREALAEQPAQQALDKKAENARELGLDYEPAQQEPVVWMYVNKSTHETKFQKHMRDFVDHSLWSEVPLYGEPLANHELQCICGAIWLGDEMVHLPDKRLPPQRTWVGLVWGELPEDGHNHDYLRGAVWAEAKLREKNT